MMNSKILFLIFFIISYVKCFKTGVTRQSCTSMRPEHKRPNTDWAYAPQFTRDPPFEIKVNTTKVKPGDLVEVVLTSKGKYDFFKGYFMQVFEDKSFFSKLIPFPQGSWIPLGRSRTLKCHIYEDSISHTEASYKRNVTMLWKAPQAITHPFKVKATVVRNYTHYWEEIYSPTIYPTEVITIVNPPITPGTGSSDDQAKQDLLQTLAKEVGVDSAKELLEILKQKVDEKNNPQILTSTVSPTKTADQKITDLKNKHPTTANKIETVAKNPGILDKVKNLFGGGSKSSDGGGLFSGLLGGGSGLMSMLPMLMPLLSGGGGPLSALMGRGKSSSPLSMITSMMGGGGGGGAGGLMSSLLGGGGQQQQSNPLAALMGGGGGRSSNPLASFMGGGGGRSSNPLASLMGGGGGGSSNPLASLMGGGGGGSSNPLASLMGGGGRGGSANPFASLMGGSSGQSNPMAALMGGQSQPQAGGGNSLSALMSNPAVTSMLKSITGGGGSRPPPTGGAGGQNLAALLGVDPNAGAPKTELAENTSGTKARPINNNAFPQMIGNTRTQNQAGGFGNGIQMGFPGMQGNNGMRANGMFQGANRQMNNLQGQQGMFRGQQQFMGQNGRQLQGQMNRMPGSFGRFPQGQGSFQQPNRNTGQFNQRLGGTQSGQNRFQQSQPGQSQPNQRSTVIDMNKIQSMMNGPNGDVIKNAMQEMLAGRKTAAEVMALVNSHPSSGNTGGSGMTNQIRPGGFNNGMTNSANSGGFNNPNRQGGLNNGMTNSAGQGGFNNGMANSAGQGGFNNGMTNSAGHGGFNQGQGVSNQGLPQSHNRNANFNNMGTSHGGNTGLGVTGNNNPSLNTGPDPNINPPPSNINTPSTGMGGFINMPDFTSMLGGNSPSSSSASGSSAGGGGLPDLSSLLGKSADGSSPDLSKMLENVDMSQISSMMGGLNGGDIKGMLSGPQGADLMGAASALMSGGKVDDSNPLAAMLNGPQGAKLKGMAADLMKGGGGGLAGLLGGAGGGGGGLGGIMSMLGR